LHVKQLNLHVTQAKPSHGSGSNWNSGQQQQTAASSSQQQQLPVTIQKKRQK